MASPNYTVLYLVYTYIIVMLYILVTVVMHNSNFMESKRKDQKKIVIKKAGLYIIIMLSQQ